jgi:ubiquinone/menaquinone biosynthesis C-methylase UbiE
MNSEYYSNYGDDSIDSYVDEVLLKDELENQRTDFSKSLCPDDVETVLDVGAGHGLLMEQLSKKYTCEGLEITEDKVDFIKRRFNLKATQGSAHKLPFEDQSFDMLYCCEVLEHLPFGIYEKALQELQRVSKKYIIVSVPYNEAARSARCPYCRTIFNPNYHFRTFSQLAMEQLFDTYELVQHEAFGKCKDFSLIPKVVREYILPKKFKSTTLCPACGYCNQPDSTGVTPTSKPSPLSQFLPKKPRWHIAVYRKRQVSQ